MNCIGVFIIPSLISAVFTAPLILNKFIQAYTRIRNEVQKGNETRSNNIDFNLLLALWMPYDIGYPTKKHIAVAVTDKTIEFLKAMM